MFYNQSSYVGPRFITFDTSLLSGWYQAKTNIAALSAMRAAGISPQIGSQKEEKILPPWDHRIDQKDFDERLRNALKGGDIFGSKDPFFKQDMPDEQRELFKAYKALLHMQTLAEFAADEKTFGGRLPGLDSRFQSGMSDTMDFVNNLISESYLLSNGKVDDKSETSVTIARPLTNWTGLAIQTTAFDDPIPGLVGNEVFTISSLKSGVTTDVVIDLANISGTLNLDNIVDYINTELTANGIFSKIKRERIYDKEAFDAKQDRLDPDPLPTSFGFKIEGVSTEKISFSSAGGAPAIYVAGTSGLADDQTGQFLKLTDIAGGTPTIAGGDRVALSEDQTADAVATALDSKGHVYVLGNTDGSLGNFVNQGDQDMYLRKYDSTGTLIWEQMLGTTDTAEGFGLAIDANDDVVVVGSVKGMLSDAATGGSTDTFVTKYNTDGQELFTRQTAPGGADGARAVTIAADGSIIITGVVETLLASTQTYGGGHDGYVTKLDNDGALLWNRQFGGAADETGDAITVDANGDIFVASTEDGNIKVTKYGGADGTSAALWSVDLGAAGNSTIGGIKVDGTDVYLVGSTDQAAFGSSQLTAHSGDMEDGFLVKIADGGGSGSVDFTTFVAGGDVDRINDITISGGAIYVAGETRGDLGAGTYDTGVNGFVAEFDTSGTRNWAYQYEGFGGNATAQGIAVDPTGSSVLDKLGILSGEIEYAHSNTITANSTVRAGDYFRISMDGDYGKKIIIDDDETMRSLTFKINRVLMLDGKASVRRTSDGDVLVIEVNKGTRIDLIAGLGESDALKGLGITVTTVYDSGSLLDDQEVRDATTPIYGLGLDGGLTLKSQTSAAFALEVLNDALKQVRDVFRDITKDPALEDLLKNGSKASGPVPAYLSAQLANYQAGLARLGGGLNLYG
jgi:hypothetical protein